MATEAAKVVVEGSSIARAGNSPPASDYDSSPNVTLTFPYHPSITTLIAFTVLASASWNGRCSAVATYYDVAGYHQAGNASVQMVAGGAHPGGFGDVRQWSGSLPCHQEIRLTANETTFELRLQSLTTDFGSPAASPFYDLGSAPSGLLATPDGWTASREYTLLDVTSPTPTPTPTPVPVPTPTTDQRPPGTDPYLRPATMQRGPYAARARF